MEGSYNFYQIKEVIKEVKIPIKLGRASWEDIELFIMPYILEEGEFDNIHLCWRSALGGIVKKIVEKRQYKFYTISLNACEYYAVKELLDGTLVGDTVIPGLLFLAEQINKARPPEGSRAVS